jgi:uncharacterized protein
VKPEVFLDSSFIIASISDRDRYHSRALKLDQELQRSGSRVITTHAVLLEIGNSLAKPRTRMDAGHAIIALQRDPTVQVISLDAELLDRGLRLFQSRPDKEWGFVDCVSFVVMSDRSLTDALTSDVHFEQAGFVALLRR